MFLIDEFILKGFELYFKLLGVKNSSDLAIVQSNKQNLILQK